METNPSLQHAAPTVEAVVQCPHCRRTVRGIKRRRRNTRYVDDERNFVTTCLRCFHEEEAYWAERWAEYYADCM